MYDARQRKTLRTKLFYLPIKKKSDAVFLKIDGEVKLIKY